MIRIDIIKPPLSAEKIARLRTENRLWAENTAKLIQQHDRTLLRKILLLILAVLGASLLMVFSISSFSRGDYISFVTLFLVSSGCCLGVILLENNIRSLWIKMNKFEKKIKSTKLALSDAKPGTCLEIQSWLDEPILRTYRDAVVAQGRVFINAEVEAMREYYEGRAEREAREKKEIEIKAACKAVYGVVSFS